MLKQNVEGLSLKTESLAQQNVNMDAALKNAYLQINDTRHHIAKTHAIVVQNLRPLMIHTDGYASDASRAPPPKPADQQQSPFASGTPAVQDQQQNLVSDFPASQPITGISNDPMLSTFAINRSPANISNLQTPEATLKRSSDVASLNAVEGQKRTTKIKKKTRMTSPLLFTPQQDEILLNAVQDLQDSWHEVADLLKPHDPAKCKQRWLEIKPKHVQETPHRKDSTRWQKLEDLRIVQSKQRVDEEQAKGILYDSLTAFWSRVALGVPGRTAAQCQARYNESLDPQVIKGQWTQEEIQKLKDGVIQFGQSWCKIGLHVVQGRTQRQCRGRFLSLPEDVQKDLLAQHLSTLQQNNSEISSEENSDVDEKGGKRRNGRVKIEQ